MTAAGAPMSVVADRLLTRRRAAAHPGSAHDRIVRTTMFVLPVLIGVLAAFLVTAPIITGGDVSFVLDKNKVAMAKERLRVQSALYRGQDNKGRPFSLRAGSAVQKSSAEPIVQLNALAAQIQLEEGPANIDAKHGRYNMQSQQVAVDGPIQVRGPNGYTLDTNDATVDLKTRKMASGGAVTGQTPMGTFSGDRLSADLEGRTVSLDGKARLRIVPRRANRR
jgi:lipopolysaccharide export system protein LptC